ncbi:AAA family ATPase, partial [Xanthomonas oryzae]|uniref:AAA family ATPase n=2 Tax=Xanthomonas oryzae TaxID=347 RepID=UPI000959E07F
MQLKSFQVTNFRSIKNSGDIDVSRITALLGRNESGKSNLLRGLHSLKPLDGFKPLNRIKDFPRDRRLEECTDCMPVVSTTWELNDNEKAELLDIIPRATDVTKIVIGRQYQGKTHSVSFPELKSIVFVEADIKSKVKRIASAIRAKASKENALEAAADAFERANSTLIRNAFEDLLGEDFEGRF